MAWTPPLPPAPAAPPARPRRRGLLIGALVAAIVLVLGAGVWLLVTRPAPATAGAEPAGPVAVADEDLTIGSCLEDWNLGADSTVRVPCAGAHGAELFARGVFPDSPWPGTAWVHYESNAFCQNAALAPLGTVPPELLGQVTVQSTYPSETAWAANARWVDCGFTASGDASLVGSFGGGTVRVEGGS